MANPAKLTGDAPPQAVKRAARNLRIWGSVGLWVESVLGVISGVILIAAILIYSSTSAQGGGNPLGGGVGFSFAAVGLVAIGISSYFFSRYTRISKRLAASNAANRPSRADILRLLRIGLIVNLCGMAVTLLGAFPFTGLVLSKALIRAGSGGIVIDDPSKFVNAFDILIFQAFLNSIFAHFAGVVTSLWLLDRITR